jgi:hypothetical protein
MNAVYATLHGTYLAADVNPSELTGAGCLVLQIFSGALSALAVMTVLSALLGWAAPNLVRPRPPEG